MANLFVKKYIDDRLELFTSEYAQATGLPVFTAGEESNYTQRGLHCASWWRSIGRIVTSRTPISGFVRIFTGGCLPLYSETDVL